MATHRSRWVALDDATALAETQRRTANYPTVFAVHVDRSIAHQGKLYA